jgi:exodeoxyribonuclease VII large subunit
MLHILRRRFENIEVVLYPVKVQGAGAADEIAQGIGYLGEQGGVDVIIVGRGGGSLEDLWAFNEEAVARAIFASSVPVISAVGHETDFTIADFVADVRAPTPSAAAEIAVREKGDLLRMLRDRVTRMGREMDHFLARSREQIIGVQGKIRDPRRRIEENRLRLDEYWGRLATTVQRTWRENRERAARVLQILLAQDPLHEIRTLREGLSQLNKRLQGGTVALVDSKRTGWEKQIARLDAMSPLAILQRGYSITRRLPDGLILKDADEMRMNGQVAVRLHRGELICRVEGKG